MNLLDVNVWLALVVDTHQHHPAATEWLAEIEEPEAVRFCRGTQQSLVRLLTTASVTRPFASCPTVSPKLWMDAYLAAFAVTAGLTMVTIDVGFRQFSGLGQIVLD